MSNVPLISPSGPKSVFSYLDPPLTKKWTLIALSTLFALGMIFSYCLGAPWFVCVALFALALAPLCPISANVNQQRNRIPNLI